MAETTSAYTDTILHPIYGKSLTDLENQTLLFDLAEKKEVPVPGGQSYIAGTLLRDGPGFGSSTGGGDVYPNAGGQGYQQAKIVPAYPKLRFQTDRELFAHVTSEGAFASSMLELVEQRKEKMRMLFELWAFGAGDGIVAKVQGAQTAVTSLKLQYHGGTTKTLGALGSRNLQGFNVMIDTTTNLSASPPVGDFTEIQDISNSDTVIVSPAVTVADADSVVIAETSTKNTYNGVINGLKIFIKATGTYLNINRANYHRWHGGASIGAGTVAPSVTHLRQLQSALLVVNGRENAKTDAGVGPATIFITSPSVMDYMFATAQAGYRFAAGGKPIKADMGTSGFGFDGFDVRASIQCDTDRIYGIDLTQPNALNVFKWGKGWDYRVPELPWLPVGENNQVEMDMWCAMAFDTLQPRAIGVVTGLDPTIIKVWG